jgi:multidrug efflux system membrane fusion protein
LLVVLAGGGAWYWKTRSTDAATDASPAASAGAGGGAGGRRLAGGGNRAQPVSAQAAKTADIRLLVSAIGTITALQTATVRSRVDGELIRLAFKEGDVVKAGQVLVELDHRPYQVALDQAKGALLRDGAQLRNAQLDLARYRDLLAKDSIASQQVDTQEALVRQLEGTVAADKAAVDSAQLQLDYSTVKAPISGRLGLRQVDLGNVVHASDAAGLVTITQTQPISVVFAVPDTYLSQILSKLHSGKPLAVQAWDRDQKQMLAKGRVTITDNAVDATTGTIKLKAEFSNADNLLFPNQFVNIRLELDTQAGALAVPSTSIQRGSMGTFVYVIQPEGTVALKRVTTGAVDGDWVSVQGDLQPGDKLVTDGADRLRDGAKVEIIEAKARNKGRPTDATAPARTDAAKGKPADSAAPPAAAAPAALATASPAVSPAPSPSPASASAPAGAAAPETAAAPEGGRPAWMDRLPPELVEKLKAMSPEDRRAYLKKLRERRQQQDNGG